MYEWIYVWNECINWWTEEKEGEKKLDNEWMKEFMNGLRKSALLQDLRFSLLQNSFASS